MTGPDAVRGRGGGGAPTLLAVVLAAGAGAVDAICFDRVFAVFPANQSGNAVLLGIGIGDARGGAVWRPALAITGFALGVAGALVAGSRVAGRRRPALLLAAEILVLAPVAVVVARTPHPRADLGTVTEATLLLLAAAAMGVQTEVIGRAAGVAVATTYQSGAIVRIAELATARVAAARRPEAGRGLVVLLAVLGGYVGGAALGAALGSWSPALLVPLGTLVVVGVVVAVAPEPFVARYPAEMPHGG